MDLAAKRGIINIFAGIPATVKISFYIGAAVFFALKLFVNPELS